MGGSEFFLLFFNSERFCYNFFKEPFCTDGVEPFLIFNVNFVIVGHMLILAFSLVLQCNVLEKVRVPECGKVTYYIQRNNDMMIFVLECLGNILDTAGRVVVSYDFLITPLKYSRSIHIRHENFYGYNNLLCNICNAFSSCPDFYIYKSLEFTINI